MVLYNLKAKRFNGIGRYKYKYNGISRPYLALAASGGALHPIKYFF